MTPWPRVNLQQVQSTSTALPVLTRYEERSLQMASGCFTGLGAVDATFRQLERWGLVTIEKAEADPRFWFATVTTRGRSLLSSLEARR